MESMVGAAASMAQLTRIQPNLHSYPSYKKLNLPCPPPQFAGSLSSLSSSISLPKSTSFLVASSPLHHNHKRLILKHVCQAMSSSATRNEDPLAQPYQPQVDQVVESSGEAEKFDWYAQWYPVMPVCDLDKKVPVGKKIMGLDVVVWWDRNEAQWKVFSDLCPHRLAPLSEGRIDQWGRLQCVYHGWCFSGSGDCKLIPQAPPNGPPVNTSKKACATVYPSTVQNEIVWFWPNSDPEFKDILQKKRPPFIPELDDPSFSRQMATRDINYGYEVLIENLMDPAHLPYSHYGLLPTPQPENKVDREGGRPLDISVTQLDINGFTVKQQWGAGKFLAPCIYYSYPVINLEKSNGSASIGATSKDSSQAAVSSQRKSLIIFICIPVSPGQSRLIWSFPRNFALWMDRIIPQWFFHMKQNLVLDSDLYLVHAQERKIMELGPSKWQKICFVPTKSDAVVVGFRRWLVKYSQGQVDWGTKFNDTTLPPSPPREQLLDRYWSHVVNCPSCSVAYKAFNLAETMLQVISVGLIGVIGLAKHAALTRLQRTTLFCVAVLCFAASKWLSQFTFKNFHYHDYNHALV